MTLYFGTVIGLALGVVLGHRWWVFVLAGLVWYYFLGVQTAYLAEPGQTGFGGANGNEAIRDVPYWLVQPPLLLVTLGLTLLGGRLHDWALARIRR
jgi:hypothetical protein